MEENRQSSIGEVKFMHFTKLHKRVQNKYEEMQKKLQKSMSMDSLLTDDVFVSSTEQPRSLIEETKDDSKYEILYVENVMEKHRSRESVILEGMEAEDAFSQDLDMCFTEYITEGIESLVVPTVTIEQLSDSPEEYSPILKCKVFNDDISVSTNDSREELSEIHKEHDEEPKPTVPPKTSIRNRIGSRISAVKERRRRKEIEKLNSAKKKDDREKIEKQHHIFSKTIKQDIVNVKPVKKIKIATVTVGLIEANGLPLIEKAETKFQLMHVRIKLGTEKAKSKIIKNISTKVEWFELFSLNMFDDDELLELSLWDKEIVLGRCNIDLSTVDKEKTHRMRITLNEIPEVELFILLTITGTSLVNTVCDADDYLLIDKEVIDTKKTFAWHHVNSKGGKVGCLKVIVYGAMGLAGNDCHCILELGNDRLQTQTECRTNNPTWMKVFTFQLTDITSILELTVHDEKKSEDVGKISLALLDITNGEKKWYALKDISQKERAKGTNPRILLEMTVFWSLIRASLNVITPKEDKYLESEEKLDRHLFVRNLSRAKAVVYWVFDAFKVIKNCFEWESRRLNVLALVIWLLTCWHFKVWMIPLMLLIPFVWYRPEKYYFINWQKYLIIFKIIRKPLPVETEQEHLKHEKEKEEKTSLRQKFNSIQEMVLSVQSFIGKLACFGESIKNLFNFNVPFLSCLAIFFIVLIALVMYLVPIQYIFMIWGVHKFTRKILRPNRVPNNEVLDFLSRVPNDEVLLHCRALPLEDMDETSAN